jgi:hypothetical protein
MALWRRIMVWLSKATGIGYRQLPPLSEDEKRQEAAKAAEMMKRACRKVTRESRELLRLESTLRRRL